MNFQYIFIDCPAGIDVGFINAIAGASGGAVQVESS
jgi:septum site-determining protein MinD